MRIITVGKQPDPATQSLVSEYEKRLVSPYKLEFIRLKQAVGSENEIRSRESALLTQAIKPDEFLVLLDERGQKISSEQFAKVVTAHPKIMFVIGGAFGVSNELRQSATKVISLSEMVLPHRLALLILVEQIYRAQCINNGHPYHHSE